MNNKYKKYNKNAKELLKYIHCYHGNKKCKNVKQYDNMYDLKRLVSRSMCSKGFILLTHDIDIDIKINTKIIFSNNYKKMYISNKIVFNEQNLGTKKKHKVLSSNLYYCNRHYFSYSKLTCKFKKVLPFVYYKNLYNVIYSNFLDINERMKCLHYSCFYRENFEYYYRYFSYKLPKFYNFSILLFDLNNFLCVR